MPWYWIIVIISAVVGPFEAMHAWNKAKKNAEEKKKGGVQVTRPE